MAYDIPAKLAERGLSLPAAAAPVAAYVPAVEAGGLLHLSGQLPFVDGVLVSPEVGSLRYQELVDEARAQDGEV